MLISKIKQVSQSLNLYEQMMKHFIKQLLHIKRSLKYMSNWDDQFDFQDLQTDKKKDKGSNKPKPKKVANDDEDFFDVDEFNKKKQSQPLLPTINSRNSAKLKVQSQQSTAKANPFANKAFGNKQVANNYQDYYQKEGREEAVIENKQKIKESRKQLKSFQGNDNTRKTKNANKSQPDEEQYNLQYLQEQVQQPIKDEPGPKKAQKHSKGNLNQKQPGNRPSQNMTGKKVIEANKQPSDDQYEEEFEQNNQYTEDEFEQQATKSPIKKVKQIIKSGIQTKESTEYTKLPVKKNNLTSNQNGNRQKEDQQRSHATVPLSKPPVPQKKGNNVTANSNINLNKIQSHSVSKPLKRSLSRQSIRSNQQKSVRGSRITVKNESQYFPNKHSDMVSRSFPHDQNRLTQLNQGQINKINQKMRAMIRKFNEQLNNLINKNMLRLKNKNLDKQASLQQRVKQLLMQKKSGQTSIQVMEKDFDKLQGRQGQIKEQEYQLILQKQIQEKKNQIKEALKQITNAKRQVNSKGKKLSEKEQQQKNANNIHHLKTFLMQARKDQEKGDDKIQKLTSNQEQLQTKITDMDYKLDQVIAQAKQKGINIQNTAVIQRKYQQLKAKLQNVKNYNKKSENLITTKIDIINHQNQQIRITIRNINSQINNFYGSIEHSQNQSVKLIEKAKQRTNINPLFAESLQKLQRQIQQSKANTDYFEVRSQVRSRRSDSSKNRNMKNSTDQSIEKNMPRRTTQSQNKNAEAEEQSTVKPKFAKKKAGQQARFDIQSKSQVNERVWEQDQNNKNSPKNYQNSPKNYQNSLKHHQSRPIIEEASREDSFKQNNQTIEDQKKDKSKPFMIKKNRTQPKNQSKTQKIQQSPQVTTKNQKVEQQIPLTTPYNIKQQPKKQQTTNIIIAPRMMKFGRKKNDQTNSENNISLNNNKVQVQQKQIKVNKNKTNEVSSKEQGLKLQIKQALKQQNSEQGSKQIFVPKRFNLRNKANKNDDSYTPSVQKDDSYALTVQQNKKLAQKQKVLPAVNQTKQEYKPKFSFKNQQLKIEQPKKQVQKPSTLVDQPQIKPKFNLRLRDRVNNQNSEQQSVYGGPSNTINKNINDANLEPKKIQPKIQTNNVYRKDQPSNKDVEMNNVMKQQSINNPYAPKVQNTNNPYVQKVDPVSNKVQNVSIPVNNPYAQKFQNNSENQQQLNLNDGTKRQRGPLKKNKITSNMPKQSFNIYAQAEDITHEVKNIAGDKTVQNQNVYQDAITKNNKNNNQEPNLNELLGIKKQTKKNDFDDLLGDVGVGNTKKKKKQNDFFGDMDL